MLLRNQSKTTAASRLKPNTLLGGVPAVFAPPPDSTGRRRETAAAENKNVSGIPTRRCHTRSHAKRENKGREKIHLPSVVALLIDRRRLGKKVGHRTDGEVVQRQLQDPRTEGKGRQQHGHNAGGVPPPAPPEHLRQQRVRRDLYPLVLFDGTPSAISANPLVRGLDERMQHVGQEDEGETDREGRRHLSCGQLEFFGARALGETLQQIRHDLTKEPFGSISKGGLAR